jgi:YVTN family beta-propeller protein
MNRYICSFLVWLVSAVSMNALLPGGMSAGDYLSPQAVASTPDGIMLYIAGATGNTIIVFDTQEKVVKKEFVLATTHLSGLTLSKDGQTLYVTEYAPQGRVLLLDAKTGIPNGEIQVGHSPLSPVLDRNEEKLYVCNQFDNTVSIVDLTTHTEIKKIGVDREPVAAALTPDGTFLIVANHLPSTAADQDYVASIISFIHTGKQDVVKQLVMSNGSNATQGVAISPDGEYAYITHILARFHIPTTQLSRGWINTNAMTIVDLAKQEILNTVLVDDPENGAANPYGIDITKDGHHICIAHAGTHEVSIIDRAALHEKLQQVERGIKVNDVSSSPDHVPNDASFLTGIRSRIQLAGKGPRGIAAIHGVVYAAEYFSDSLGMVAMDAKPFSKGRSIPLGSTPEIDIVRQGEINFHDAGLCYQQWQSCVSCHPGGGRMDALNWDLLNDGFGNPKNTKSLLLSHKTPPAMAMGVRSSAEVAVRAGIRFIQFAQVPEKEAQAIDQYLTSLEPVPSPFLVDGALSPAALRGKDVFEKALCATCHSGDYYTDLQSYDVGTGKLMDKQRAFDTPTLVECWRTGPYLHDGRSATLRELFTQFNESDLHGKTSDLTLRELDDLIEYISSL